MSKYVLREATFDDLSTIRDLMMDDVLTKDRNLIGDLASYQKAFQNMRHYPNVIQWVFCSSGGSDNENNHEKTTIIGTLQTIIIPSLSFDGATRLEIEGVRIANTLRGQGLGQEMIHQVFDYARQKHCKIIQLTTNNKRVNSQRFYLSLGFVASHIGMKYYLDN